MTTIQFKPVEFTIDGTGHDFGSADAGYTQPAAGLESGKHFARFLIAYMPTQNTLNILGAIDVTFTIN